MVQLAEHVSLLEPLKGLEIFCPQITHLEKVIAYLGREHVPLPPRKYLSDDGIAHVMGHNVRRTNLELPPHLEGVLGGGEDGVDVLRVRGLVREAEADVVEHHDAELLLEDFVAPGVVVARGGKTVDEYDGLGDAVGTFPALSVEHLEAVRNLDVTAAALPIAQV